MEAPGGPAASETRYHPTPRRSRGAPPCHWLKDRFGLSWQVIPKQLPELLSDPDPEKARRAMAAMLKMKKIDLAELEREAAR
jgi:predicted 3-demethylubiquinone-9 3-methyltransferase (glyoxalase superfamily)